MVEDEKKQILKKIFQQRLDENKSLPQNQQFEHVVKTETIEPAVKYKRTTKKLVKLETGLCPECECTTYCIDYHHGERVCPRCGYVFSMTVFEKPRFKPIKQPELDIQYSFKEKQYLKTKNYHFVTEAKEWKHRQIRREIDVISSTLDLNKASKDYVIEIIEKQSMKKLHSTADTTTIICAVARYIMKNKEHKGLVRLRFDRGLFNENLTRHDYDIVEKNIEKHFGDAYAYKPKTETKEKNKSKRKHQKHNSHKTFRTNRTRKSHIQISKKRNKNKQK